MPRVLFEKKGRSVWISHLDLMRLFQRAFKRAGLPLKHTQGYNPRPSVSIALPLSVGVESTCELLDFDLEDFPVTCEEICEKLNGALVDGVRVLRAYENGRKIRDLALLDCTVTMVYDKPTEQDTVREIQELFAGSDLKVTKKTKNGPVEQDVLPMIKRISVVADGENKVVIRALICCQNPSLNPALLVSAVERYLPHRKPDQALIARNEIYDNNETIFR